VNKEFGSLFDESTRKDIPKKAQKKETVPNDFD
jgi:hypothetical protein